ncbi:tetratricopeptide repeat protein [Streptomyces sp. NPDC001595]|uniref:tetratricopeptide repeat protein n=1 Tax=Streptomyces sp. NPDC001532 TaxID=3154520 RepID=UPI00331BD3E4
MSRPSREKQPEQQPHGTPPATPIDVRVFAGSGPDTAGATVGGTSLAPVPGEEPQQTVLNHLHRIARAAGRPVLATVHDERIGYVVPLQVDPDGSSRYTAQPYSTPARQSTSSRPEGAQRPEGAKRPEGALRHEAVSQPDPRPGQDARPQPDPRPAHPPLGGGPTQVLRVPQTPAPQAWPEPAVGDAPDVTQDAPLDSAPTFRLRAVPEPARVPGTVTPPTGAFGPPPVMAPATDAPSHPTPGTPPTGAPAPAPSPRRPSPSRLDPDPRPTPPRGFDAVAEAVLGDEVPATAPTPLTAPLARISEAVKEGRIDTASTLAEQALGDGAAMLGADHPEVLRLGELTAYIAYLAGDPARAFRLSVDLVQARRRTGDAEAAYGNVQSAATAWRAVRDPLLGLDLGRELIGLWSELAAEPGPAAEDVEELESAHSRMTRLTERARKAAAAQSPAE